MPVTHANAKNKIIAGSILIGLSIILFILTVIPNFAVTSFFCGLLGLSWYAILVVAILVGIALILNLKYNYNKRFTTYLCLFVCFLIMFLHAIFSSSALSANVGFAKYGDYLNSCYNLTNGITVGGAVFGIFVYLLRTLLGIVGVYCVLVICVAIFAGLVIDRAIYGATRVKKANKTATNAVLQQKSTSQINSYSQTINQPQQSADYNYSLPDEQPNYVQDEATRVSSYSSEAANNNFTTSYSDILDDQPKRQESAGVRSAKEILFGNRDIPDVTMPNDRERDRWMNNYLRQQDQPEQPENEVSEPEQNLSDLFGGFDNSARFADSSAQTRDFSRGAGETLPNDESVINRGRDIRSGGVEEFRLSDDNATEDDDFEEFRDTPVRGERERRSDFGGRHNSQQRIGEDARGALGASRFGENDRLNQSSNADRLGGARDASRDLGGRDITSARIDTGSRFGGGADNKLGSGMQDKASGKVPTFGSNLTNNADKMQINASNMPARDRQDKQMGFKAVRYNSIPLSVFRVYQEQNIDYSKEYAKNTEALEKVFADFRIAAKVINIVRGPKVTRYELSLPDGVPISKVTSLQDNIALETAARSRIRIEAPIPGKRAVGIELENENPSMVGMRELLESPEFINCKDPLPIAIGKDINGKVIIKSLPKMVHLLVAGSTGSGKSIFIHTLMMSILYKYSPDDVRFIMVDPKRVEFSMYNNLPHLMFPEVVCEHDKALNSIKWCCKEMETRLQMLRNAECQNIDQYNRTQEVTSGRLPKMPYLVIVVDELAELMGSPMKKDFEAGIQRITQLGRAAGLHMVVATQRPSVDVVTGTIKNNMPTRIAFALASGQDSRTVLDEYGAENLLGKGDMLFAPQDMNIKIRLQAAFCDNDEIRNAIKYVKENNVSTYDEEVFKEVYAEKEQENVGGDGGAGASDGDDMDEYMKLAVKFAMSTGKVSVSMLQRKFRIGFNRAARIVDQMSDLGLVGPSVGAKPRDFSITREQYQDLFGEDFDDSDPV